MTCGSDRARCYGECMHEVPRPLHREALPSRSRNGIYGPVAAMATIMLMSVASLAIVVAPHARERHVPVMRVHVFPPRATVGVALPPPAEICHAPVYHAGVDGRA